MDRTYNTNSVWTTNNGFIIENRRPNTPGKYVQRIMKRFSQNFHFTINTLQIFENKMKTLICHVI